MPFKVLPAAEGGKTIGRESTVPAGNVWDAELPNGGTRFVWKSEKPRVAMSYRNAKPPRTAVLPSPITSQAKPSRGLKLCNEGFLNGGPTVGAGSVAIFRKDAPC